MWFNRFALVSILLINSTASLFNDSSRLRLYELWILSFIALSAIGEKLLKILAYSKQDFNKLFPFITLSNNPKDKGPFPEYTLWYSENNELVKYEFINWKDDKLVQGIRRE